jgi:hypothetical protein
MQYFPYDLPRVGGNLFHSNNGIVESFRFPLTFLLTKIDLIDPITKSGKDDIISDCHWFLIQSVHV